MLLEPAPTNAMLAELKGIRDAVTELHRWIMQRVVGDDVFPRSLPEDLSGIFDDLHHRSESLESILREVEQTDSRLLFGIMSKLQSRKALSEEEYYLARATGVLTHEHNTETEYTNYLSRFEQGHR